MLEERIKDVLAIQCGIYRGNRLLVGISGGPDSIVLLDLLDKINYFVVVAHLDHQLRDDSGKDLEYVRNLAYSRGFEFLSDTCDTKRYAKKNRLSIEEAARELRYQFLFKSAEEINACAVVVGHNADDQVETVVMHLLRGSGLDGLSGMSYLSYTQWSENIPLLRPMLGVEREEILKYCDTHDLKPLYDLSNLDITYFRNRIRHELIPTLETFNPKIKNILWKMSQTISEDKKVLEESAGKQIKSLIREKGKSHVALNLHGFEDLDLGMKRRVLRNIISWFRPGLRDIGYERIERLIESISNPPASGQTDLFSGLRLRIEKEKFIISDWDSYSPNPSWPQLNPGESFQISIPGTSNFGLNWELKATILEPDMENMALVYNNKNPFMAYIDPSACRDQLLVRPRIPGDRFSPLGMEGNKIKVSDFMINLKLPVRARKFWPLVFSGEKLIWIPGYRISEDVKVGESTEKIVQISLKKSFS